MIWIQEGGKTAPQHAVDLAYDAHRQYNVPVGILLATCEAESNFRLGLVSSADAVGPMQFKRKFAEDYYRYAGFAFDLEGWESMTGAAAVFATYARWAEARGFTGDGRWRFALVAHRWGQNSAQAKDPAKQQRVLFAEEAMRRNGLWYDHNGPMEEEPMEDVKTYSLDEDGDKRLTANFWVHEFACKDGSDQVLISGELVEALQAIRERFGAAVHISSGYRTQAYNRKVGGATASKHLSGQAADVRVTGVEPVAVALYAESLGLGGVGLYDYGPGDKAGFVHVDVREGKRARWIQTASNGSPRYVDSLAAAMGQQEPGKQAGPVYAICAGEGVNLRQGPGTGYASLGRVVKESKLLAGPEEGGWRPVAAYLGSKMAAGYMAAQYVQEVEA